jgi:hypothetical protein
LRRDDAETDEVADISILGRRAPEERLGSVDTVWMCPCSAIDRCGPRWFTLFAVPAMRQTIIGENINATERVDVRRLSRSERCEHCGRTHTTSATPRASFHQLAADPLGLCRKVPGPGSSGKW